MASWTSRARASRIRRPWDDEPFSVRVLVSVARRLRFLYTALGVDPDAMEDLLRVKLLLDHRRRRRDGNHGVTGNIGFGLMVFMYTSVGVLMGVFAFEAPDPAIYMGVSCTLVLLLLMFPLLADFSMILLDTSDLELLGPLPLSDRTVLAVRISHILLYIGTLLAALGLGPLVLGSIAYPPWLFIPVLLAGLVQMAVLALSSVVVLYLLALKSLDLSRFRDAMVYLQSGAFAIFYLGTQLGPRLLQKLGVLDYVSETPEALLAVPSAATGSLLRMVLGGGEALDPWILASGWGVTLLLFLWAAFLAREGFVRQLAALESSGGRPRTRARHYGITGYLSTRVPARGLERAGWRFFLQMSSSERMFKMRSLPLFVMICVPALMLLLMEPDSGIEELKTSLPLLPYLLLFVLPSIWETARFSANWEGRWIFDDMSREDLSSFVRGAMKAAYTRYLVVPLFFSTFVIVGVCELDRLFDFALAAGVALSAGALMLPWFGGFAPFATKFSQSLAQSNVGIMFMSAGLIGVLGVGQWALSYAPYVTEILAVLAIPVAIRMWRRLGSVPLRLRREHRHRRRHGPASA